LLEERTRKWRRADLLGLLEKSGVPCAEVNDTASAYANEQVRHREMLRHVDHPLTKSLPMVSNRLRFSGTRLDRYDPPPLLGQHTEDVLREILGCPTEDLEDWRRAEII